jgi:Rrf2 family protein
MGKNTYICAIKVLKLILSKKTKYAMVALARLARDYGREPIQIRDIAESEKIPQRFLENILLELRKLGILGSKLGKEGGYFLLKKPSEVSLLEIVRHFEGTIALMYCVSEKAYQPCEFCKDEATCRIRKVFKDVRDTTYEILKRTSLESLIQDQPRS